MEAVKAFNSELAGLYECKPPISKAKMTAITKGAIRAIKFYKHVVQSVEKFIQKCKTEYKIPGLYVIDSIVRQSRHQFGIEKDVFAPRFAKNVRVTFFYLFKCPQEDKSKVIRVLNLWQKNQVFAEDIIQPLFDLADPNSSVQKEVANQIAQKANKAKAQQHFGQDQLQQQHTPTSVGGGAGGGGGVQGGLGPRNEARVDAQMNNSTASLPQQPVPVTSVSNQVMTAAVTNLDPGLIQQIQQILMKQPSQDDGSGMAAAAAAAAAAGMVPPVPEEVKSQVIPGITSTGDYDGRSLPFLPVDTSQPPPGYLPQGPFMGGLPPAPMAVPPPSLEYSSVHLPPEQPKSPLEDGEHSEDSDDVKEVIPEDRDIERRRSRSRSRSRSRRKRRSRTRSRSRSRSRHRRSRSRSRGRRSSSRSRRRRSRSRDRDRDRDRDRRDRDRDRDRDKDRKKDREKEKLDPEKERAREKDREKEEERKKRGLPPIKAEFLSVCSTTLWVGHLSKLVYQEELSDTFGEYGDIVSIDLIPPRGCAFICMNRRQDAARALNKLRNHKMQNKAITLAWAPGKGVKGKEFKDYWEVEVGCSYIPYRKLITMSSFDLDSLEEGGMIDEETVPDWLRGRYGHQSAPAPGPPPGFVPIGVPPGHPPPNSRGQDVTAPLPPLPPPVEKSQDRDGSALTTSAPGMPPNPQGMPPNPQGLPPNILPPPFGLPNMPPPQVGPGPGGMPPLPQGLMPPNLPPLGVPPPIGLPPLGVHPPVSSILGQPLIGTMPPSVSMAPNVPSRPMLPPGSSLQNSISAPPVTSMANNNSHDSNDMDIEMEDVEKNVHGKENGLSSKDKDDDRRERSSRFERPGARSPSGHEKMVERLKNIASGGDIGSRDRYDRDRDRRDRDHDRERGRSDQERDSRDRERDRDRDRDRDHEDSRGRGISDRFGPDAFSAPPPGFPQVRPPNFRPDGPSGPNGRVGPGGFNSFVPVPGFGPPGGGGASGVPPRMMGGPPPGPRGPSGLRNDSFPPVGMGMLSGPNGPGFGPRGMHGPGGFNAPRGLLGPPPLGLGSVLGGRPPLLGEMGGRPNGPGGIPGQRPGMWMDGPGPRFQGLNPHGGPQGLRDGMPDRAPWDTDRSRDDRSSDVDRFRDERVRNDDRARDLERERSRDDHFRDDISRDDRSRDDRSRDDRPRDDRDRSRDDRSRDDRSRDSRSRDDRSRDDRFRDDRSREDRSRDDRYRDERYRDDRSRDDRSRSDRLRDDRSRDSRPRDDRYQNERSRDMDRPWESNRYRDDRSRDFDKREEKRPWEKSRWGPQLEDESAMCVEESEPDSWDIWAKISGGNPNDTPSSNPAANIDGTESSKSNMDESKMNVVTADRVKEEEDGTKDQKEGLEEGHEKSREMDKILDKNKVTEEPIEVKEVTDKQMEEEKFSEFTAKDENMSPVNEELKTKSPNVSESTESKLGLFEENIDVNRKEAPDTADSNTVLLPTEIVSGLGQKSVNLDNPVTIKKVDVEEPVGTAELLQAQHDEYSDQEIHKKPVGMDVPSDNNTQSKEKLDTVESEQNPDNCMSSQKQNSNMEPENEEESISNKDGNDKDVQDIRSGSLNRDYAYEELNSSVFEKNTECGEVGGNLQSEQAEETTSENLPYSDHDNPLDQQEIMEGNSSVDVSHSESYQEDNKRETSMEMEEREHQRMSSPAADELSIEASMNITSMNLTNQEDPGSPEQQEERDGDGQANEGFDDSIDHSVDIQDGQDDVEGGPINED